MPLSPEVEQHLANAQPDRCVRCHAPAAFRFTVVLANEDGQPNGGVHEIWACGPCGEELLAKPSAKPMKFGEA